MNTETIYPIKYSKWKLKEGMYGPNTEAMVRIDKTTTKNNNEVVVYYEQHSGNEFDLPIVEFHKRYEEVV